MQQPSTLAKPRMFDFVSSSSKLGIKTGVVAAVIYLLLLSLLLTFLFLPSAIVNYSSQNGTSISVLINELVIVWLMVWGYGIIFGFLPTLLLGSITGALLGALVYQTHTRFSKLVLSMIACLICVFIIACVAALITQGGYLQRNWFLWYFIPPAVIYIVIAGPATAYIYHRLESYQEH
jgi:hypothetical protein